MWTDPTGAPEVPPGYIWVGWNRKKTVYGNKRQVLSKLPAGSTHAPHPSLVKGSSSWEGSYQVRRRMARAWLEMSVIDGSMAASCCQILEQTHTDGGGQQWVLRVTVHGSRVTIFKRRIEPWKHLPVALVNVTSTLSAATQTYFGGSDRSRQHCPATHPNRVGSCSALVDLQHRGGLAVKGRDAAGRRVIGGAAGPTLTATSAA
jgi:hypothetical protein